jgi:cytosine/adenosine deaminase-related metal-dependent hydrolase/ubiquinone/menaquinone biosynthesis C-methylase UbiE
MSNAPATTCLRAAEGYRLWAQTYDREANPMLSLEKRVLQPLLPGVVGADVVDLGCGTGRWLEALRELGAGSLLGLDFSAEMIEVAKSKLGGRGRLMQANCADAPLAAESADLVLCNFVLSYVEDADRFLAKVRQMLRPGGSLFLTDIHPGTASALNWRRGVGTGDGFQEIRTYRRSIEEVIASCARAGLELCVRLEPRFGDEERQIFKANGKRKYFESIAEFPAIYVLQLRALNAPERVRAQQNVSETITGLCGARFALGPGESFHGAMEFADRQISSLREERLNDSDAAHSAGVMDLRGFLVLPGLINAHDHLEFALFPRMGRGGYKNFLEWVEDIYHPGISPISEHRQVPRETRLWWGGVRNLLCGVTTVCHHNPYEPDVFDENFVIRVLKEYGWAHSLAMDAETVAKKRETPAGQPFLVHLGEGIDERSAREIFELRNSGGLDANTVIIHGLGMDAKGRALLRSANAGLIWCPSSNDFLFGRTLSVQQLRKIGSVALGSDSPLTAQGDLLDEIRYAWEHGEARPEDLYNYVTGQPANMLGLKGGEGNVRVRGAADFVAVRDSGLTPAETLVTLSLREVELVLIGGSVQLASDEMMTRVPGWARQGLHPLWIEEVVRWVRAPLEQMFREATAHLGNEIHLGGKRVRFGKAN